MDVDQRLLRVRRLEERVAAGRHLAEAAADREHEIGVAQPTRDALVHGDTEHADVARRAVVDEVLAAERARNRKRVRLAERLHVAARLGCPAALADDDERALGSDEQRRAVARAPRPPERRARPRREERPPHPTPRRARPRAAPARRVLAGRRLRSRTPRPCARECARRCRSPMPPSRCRRRPARSRAPATPRDPRNARGTWPTRRIIGEESCFAVCTPTAAWVAPGPTRDEADPGPAGELPVRLRRVRRALLVATGDEPDRRVVERVEHGQVALARKAEREVDAVELELVDEDLAACPHSGTSRRIVAVCSRGFASSAGST